MVAPHWREHVVRGGAAEKRPSSAWDAPVWQESDPARPCAEPLLAVVASVALGGRGSGSERGGMERLGRRRSWMCGVERHGAHCSLHAG